MNITVIGTGFVGVVTSAVYASLGHQVWGLDIDKKKIELLKKGNVPFYEPGLKELLIEQQKKKNLNFTDSYKTAISNADVIIIAVGTPSAPDEQADLKFVFASSEALAEFIKKDVIVVVKSTVPPGTLDQVEKIIKVKTKTHFYTASLPEFLREGTAVSDTLHPDRVVIGASSNFVFEKLESIHQPLTDTILKVKPESAQMGKYSSNAYLATRITFINQIADLCEKNGANIDEVIQIIGFDKRIGRHYWYPGFGYGGSCFPKDVKELAAYSRAIGESNNLFNKINDLNKERIYQLLANYEEKVGGFTNKKIAVLGLSFKPNTDDTREAASTKVIPFLLSKAAKLKIFDPMVTWPEKEQSILQVATIETACKDSDIIFSLVEWPEIINFDFAKVKLKDKKQWFIDARNQFKPEVIKKLGFYYIGIGKTIL